MIKVILWDIDGTLLDFKEAERYALEKCFELFGFGVCSEERRSRYSEINHCYWERLERGELTKAEVLVGRFREFFTQEGLPVDQAEAVNTEYQQLLGETICFRDQSYSLVTKLKGQIKQYAVTNGSYIAQKKKLRLSGLEELLDGIFISDEVGFEKPNLRFFDYVWEKIGRYDKKEIMIVGDSLTSDMQGGRLAGIRCCWYNPDGLPLPAGVQVEKEIRNLWEIEKLL